MSDYREVNRANWDERVPIHVTSPDYALARYVEDPAHLSDVVTYDRPRLGDVRGRRGLHLQCHIGTDTISLARLGAVMTGLDFSPAAVAAARDLSARARTPIDVVESDVYAATEVLPTGGFDLVYTGIGALCWLPDAARWARTVAALLAPGGRLFLREGHPVLWALDDDRDDDLLVLAYPYRETPEPLVLDADTSYVTSTQRLAATTTHQWNHGLGETVGALLDAGLRLTQLVEHDSVPYEALPGLMTPIGGGEWRLRDRPERLPHSYTVQAVKD